MTDEKIASEEENIVANKENTKSTLVPLGVLFIVIGLLGPAVTIKYGQILRGEGVKLLFPLLTDAMRVGFFIGVALLIIGICRNKGLKGFSKDKIEMEIAAKPKQSQSNWCVISVIGALIASILTTILLAILAINVNSVDGARANSEGGVMLFIGYMLLGAVGISFGGAILGIVGIAQNNRKKTLGIIGLIINALIFFGFIALMVYGAMKK